MNFGKSLLGAIVGGGVGIAAHVATGYFGGEAFWFPVVTGLLTGLGVRKFDPSVRSGASYLRGALAGLIGLGAIYGGVQASSSARISKMAKEQAAVKAPVASQQAAEADTAAGDAAGETVAEIAEDPTAAAPSGNAEAGGKTVGASRDFSVWDFVMIGLGAFLAYEFARGNAPAAAKDEGPGEGADDQAGGVGPGPDADTPPAGEQG